MLRVAAGLIASGALALLSGCTNVDGCMERVAGKQALAVMTAVRDTAQRALHAKRASTLFDADERNLELADCEGADSHDATVSILAFCNSDAPEEIFLAEVVMGSPGTQAEQMPAGVRFGASLADIKAQLGEPLLDSASADECVGSIPAIAPPDADAERTLIYADPAARQTLELDFVRDRLDRIRWLSGSE